MTPDDVYRAVIALEPATVSEVHRALGCDWSQRQTVRNRLNALVTDGRLICDDERPARYAVNECYEEPWI